MATKFTKEVQKLVNAIDRNTRGLAKVVSGMCALAEGGVLEQYAMNLMDKSIRALVAERRLLRDALEKELKKQEGWQR
ncbi:MAG: hypothetical protein JWO13_2268 [Acidobacteriales bacterium]|nr:hypothetical protein [Terriglobales bacterium]